jgi:hypothetical protein
MDNQTMESGFDMDENNQEAGEEQLADLIKQAGEEARARRQKAMEEHFSKLRAVIDEALSGQQNTQI